MTEVKVKPLPVYTESGAIAGMVVKGHIFRKEVFGSKHMLHSPPGWAIDAGIFVMLKRYGVDVIQVLDKETKKLYVTSRETFEREGLTVDRSFGPQKVLALPFWKVTHD
jgi:hypothetical protein